MFSKLLFIRNLYLYIYPNIKLYVRLYSASNPVGVFNSPEEASNKNGGDVGVWLTIEKVSTSQTVFSPSTVRMETSFDEFSSTDPGGVIDEGTVNDGGVPLNVKDDNSNIC